MNCANTELTRSEYSSQTSAENVLPPGELISNLLVVYNVVGAGLSDSVHDESHVTCKSVPGYCDVIDDNMAAPNCHHHHHQLYHNHYDQYHQHWTIAPPPPSYSSTNWRPLQPSAPRTDSAHHCDDVTVTSPRVIRHAVDSATVTNSSSGRDAMIIQSTLADDCLLTTTTTTTATTATTCPQCRRQTPACV